MTLYARFILLLFQIHYASVEILICLPQLDITSLNKIFLANFAFSNLTRK